jgi:hypothetical protein
MVTFPSASKIGPVVIGVTFVFVVVTATHLSVVSNTLPAATGVVPEANGANGVPKVSFPAMI